MQSMLELGSLPPTPPTESFAKILQFRDILPVDVYTYISHFPKV